MVQTNWIIFSGVTSSGKSTIAEMLIRHGYKAPIEVARMYIDELRTKGISQDELEEYVTTYQFQYEIVQRGLRLEQELNPNDLVIMDCGLIGSYVYFRQRGHTEELLESGDNRLLKEHLAHNRYRGVFIFEKLPCDKDPFRFGTADILRDEAHCLLKETNAYQGYISITVPVASIEERLQFILKKIIEITPTLMANAGLKQLSGTGLITKAPCQSDIKTEPVKMTAFGLKAYSGPYSSLFWSNATDYKHKQYNNEKTDFKTSLK